MAGELLKPAAGMLILGDDRGGTALFGLLMKETYVVHGRPKRGPSHSSPRSPFIGAIR